METRFTKLQYKIKEVAEIIGVPQTTLRFWEKEFPHLNPERNAGNRRAYTPKDIEQLQIIHYLLHVKGLKIDAAKEYLRRNKKNISKRIEILETLKNVRDELDMLRQALNLRGEKIGLGGEV